MSEEKFRKDNDDDGERLHNEIRKKNANFSQALMNVCREF